MRICRENTSLAELLPILRQSTRAGHEALEAEVELQTCLQTPERWLGLLETFFRFFDPLESLIFAAPGLEEILPDAARRRKCDLLKDDIERLGGDTAKLVACRHLPPVGTAAERLGVLYVMEGSTLGGQIIARMAADHGFTREHGCAYFGAYGAEAGAMWKRFCARLEEYGAARPEDHQAVVEAAVATFTLFGQWIRCSKQGISHP